MLENVDILAYFVFVYDFSIVCCKKYVHMIDVIVHRLELHQYFNMQNCVAIEVFIVICATVNLHQV